jgi:hypothetical protein
VEERQEAAINGRRSQNSERVRAHLYERGFRQEPDRRVLVGEVDRGLPPRHRRRAPQGHGRSAVPPDDSDMHLGRERPPKTRLGTVIGGWQRGSLTPQMPPSLLPAIAPTATRAANSAARLSAVKSLIAKNIATSPTDAITFLSRLVDQRTAHEQGGPLLPSLCSPLLFFAFRGFCRRPEERELKSELDVRPL